MHTLCKLRADPIQKVFPNPVTIMYVFMYHNIIVMLYLLDFKSEPNIPYSQGSFTFDDNPQCTLSYSLKEDEATLSATGILYVSLNS